MWNLLVIIISVIFYCYRVPFFHLVDPISYNISLPAKFEGSLSPNTKLDETEKLHENALHWPESFAVYNDKMYTGLGDGRIIEVNDKKITEICRTGKACAGQYEEHICGRPLGMTFSKSGRLYVVDAYHGLFSIDVKTGQKNNILPSKTVVEGLPLTFMNSIAIDEKEQAIYISQSSTKWNISYVLVSIIEHESSGRLLKFDMKTKKVTVVLTGLSFPNGVELTHDGTAILLAEGSNRIIKYFIYGEKKGTKNDLLILPGEPDNISRNKRGNYWVGIAIGRTQESQTILDMFADKPIFRKAVLFAFKIITAPVAFVMGISPYDWAVDIAFEIQHFRIIADYFPAYGIILEFDDNGKIIQSLHSPSGKIGHISEVLEHKGYLYLGSWRNRFLGRLAL